MNPMYKTQVIDPLKELFLQDNFNNIPSVEISPNSDIGIISSNIMSSSFTMKENESEEAQLEDIFEGIGDFFINDQNYQYIELINNLSRGLATIIENSYHELNDKIIPIVESLKEKITTRYRGILIRNYDADILKDETEPNDSDYSFVDWGKLNNLGDVNNIIDIVCTNVNINNRELSLVNLSYILAKIDFSNSFEHIELSSEITNNIVLKMLSYFDKYNITETDASMFVKAITNKQYYQNLCVDIIKTINSNNTAITVLKFIDFINKFDIMFYHYKSVIGDSFNNDSFISVNNNAELLNNSVYCVKYWLLCMKNITLKDKLILSRNVLNKDVYDEFVSTGKNISDIYRYVKYYFKKIEIPISGINIKTVLDSDHNDKLINNEKNQKVTDQLAKSKSLISAYNLSINEFIRDDNTINQYPKLSDDAFKVYFSQMASANASLLNGDIGNIEQAIYLTLMNSIYKDTLVSLLYRYLGVKFDILIKNNDDVTDDSIIMSQCSAIIDLLINHLFNTIVE